MVKNEFDDLKIPKFLRDAALKAERKRKKNGTLDIRGNEESRPKDNIDISRFRRLRDDPPSS